MKKQYLLASLLVTSFLSAHAFASDTARVEIGGDGAFFCTYTTGAGPLGSTVDFDTKDVLVKGFCDSPAKGHIKGLPVTELKNTYFLVKLDKGKSHGYIDAKLNGFGSLTCANGDGGYTNIYRPDGEYC